MILSLTYLLILEFLMGKTRSHFDVGGSESEEEAESNGSGSGNENNEGDNVGESG